MINIYTVYTVITGITLFILGVACDSSEWKNVMLKTFLILTSIYGLIVFMMQIGLLVKIQPQ